MQDLETNEPRPAPTNDGGDGDGLGWLWFLLVFGVGNLILYKTTGMVILPIPRK